MTVIVVRKKRGVVIPQEGFLIPEGGEILWYGNANELPEGYSVDSYAEDVFVRGAAQGQASNGKVGNNFKHKHSYNAATGSNGAHTHTATESGSTSGPSATTEEFGAPNHDGPREDHTHGRSSSQNTTSQAAHTHSLYDTNEPEIFPPYVRLYWIKATVNAALPVGGIIMFDDDIENIPDGTSICNGQGSTPDLRNKFIYGASADNQVGNPGGNQEHTHTNSNSAPTGSHSHDFNVSISATSNTKKRRSGYDGVDIPSVNHSHSASGNTGTQANHSHGFGNTLAATNIPPYLMLYFIMRTT